MSTETKSHGALVVVIAVETFSKELVGKASRLRKDIYAVADLKVDSSVVDKVVEAVLVDEVLRDVGGLDFGILGVVE